jgi:hypothetical protein
MFKELQKKSSQIIKTEEQEQTAVVQYLELLKTQKKVVAFTAIPNATFTRSWNQKNKNTRTGVRAGLPDLFIIFHQKALFIELKRLKLSSTSKEQKKWIKNINSVGITAVICKGFDEAKVVIDEAVDSQLTKQEKMYE